MENLALNFCFIILIVKSKPATSARLTVVVMSSTKIETPRAIESRVIMFYGDLH